MKKRPTPQKAASSAAGQGKREFTGTDNPRHLRALTALLRRPVPREQLDLVAGCSNGPDLISDLRARGLGSDHLYCERIKFVDRDGNVCRPGVYSLTEKGRRMVYAWLAKRDRQEGAV